MRAGRTTLLLGFAALLLAGCRDLSSFTTGSGSFEGAVVPASFVLAGVDAGTNLCLTLDTNHLQDNPGSIWTSDGLFTAVPLRPIPQVWQDPLSTLSFGEGRLKNLLYIATASTPFADGNGNDVLFVVSLMQSGDVEVRMLRGAPGLVPEGGTAATSGGNLFAVFDLTRQPGACGF
ncbi:MAG TPA: hypothetical protein VIJ22_00155 [Polyangiaceae bacterium]